MVDVLTRAEPRARSKSHKRLKGVSPVLVTPMLPDGEPDREGIRRLTDFLIDAGVEGFWAMGSASEDINMSDEGRLDAVRWIAEAVDGRVTVVVGSGKTRVDDVLRFADRIAHLKLDGLHVLYLDHKQGDARVTAEMLRLADRCAMPVWLYHNPKRGKPLTLTMIRELRDHPNIAGMKVGGYSLSELTHALMLQTPDFQVVGAGGGQMFTMLCLGAEAHTASTACPWPEDYVRLLRMFRSGDIAGARALQFRLITLAQSLPQTDNGESVAEEKYVLALRGLCHEHVNTAYRRLTADEKAKTRAALRAYGFPWAPPD
jgi:4-hydroxy-tetrahydrodipicolinate synthase